MNCVSHAPFMLHTGVAQSVAMPQSLSLKQPTHDPRPSQYKSMFAPHAVAAARGEFEGMPLVHKSSVHSNPSTGTSVSSLFVAVAPLPSHVITLQSPATLVAKVPAG